MPSPNHGNKSIKINAVLNVIYQCSTILFPLIIYPYISRVLGNDNFGRYSFAYSIVEYGLVFAMLGIPTYMVREGAKVRENQTAIKDITTEVFTISLLSMSISLSILLITVFLVPRIKVEGILIAVLCTNIVFYVLGRDWLNTIFEDFFYITVRYIVFKFLSMILILTLVKKPEHLYRYAVITVLSESGGYLMNLFYTQRYVPLSVTFRINLKRHLKPLLLLFCSTLAIRIYIQSDITLLGFMRTDAEVGVYSLASRVYSVIKAVLNAVIMVTIPRLSLYIGNNDSKSYNELLSKLKAALITLILPCVVGAFTLSKNVMLIMGGESYSYGYRAFEILCISLLFAVFGCYYAQGILVPNQREDKFLICTSVSAVLNIILNLFAIKRFGIEGAALTTLLAEMAIMISCKYYSGGLFLQKDQKDILFPVVFGCIMIFAVCKLIHLLSLNVFAETVCCIMISVILYSAILYFGGNWLARDILRAIQKKVRR